MTLVRTNITVPQDVLAYVDELAGPRGRSAYISDLLTREVKRQRSLKIIRETAGALKDSPTWGRSPEEVDATLAEIKDSSSRDRELRGEDW